MKNKIFILGGLVLGLVLLIIFNPFSYNPAGSRTCVTQSTGNQFVQFQTGVFYAGFFAKEQEWSNQISVSYIDSIPNYDMKDNTIEIGRINIRFNDATTAYASGITQYVLPSGEKEMLEVNNTHKTPEALVKRRLAPYTQECLQSSAQLMSSEMHYSGGRAQMVQDYIDQLRNGAFLLKVQKNNVYDSLEKTYKTVYDVVNQYAKDGSPKRKFSSIKEYEISVGDAQVTDVDYQTQVDQMLSKKIAASTKASISKQELMTAQQQGLTAEAQGKAQLVKIEYDQKQKQLVSIVAAQTQVELAEQDLQKQAIQEKAALKEASKIKILADANAYEKQRDIQANGALEQKLDAYVRVQEAWAKAATSSNWVPTYQMGNGGSSGASNVSNMVDLMTSKFARDLNLDTKTK